MKKILAIVLAVTMLFTVVPMSVFALNEYVVFEGIDGCRLTALSILDADNPWLLYDIPMTVSDDGRVYTTAEDHPNLISTEAVLHVEFEGKKVTFNGTDITSGDVAVKLLAQNELVVTDADKNRAEYVVIITEETHGLPVVLVDTANYSSTDPNSPLYNADNPYNPENPINTKLEYCNSHASVLGADIYDADDIYDKDCGIKLRGNSTMGYDKKPYRLKFDKKQDVLGFGKAKSWVLLADYLDPSRLRNMIAYNFADRVNKYAAEETGHYEVFSPRMNFVELYIDGEFKGLYEMGDHMQANELRVNISEWGDEEPTATGEEVGYFIEVEVMSRVLDEGEDGFGDWSAFSYIVDVDGCQKIDADDVARYENATQNLPISADHIGKEAIFFQYKLPETPNADQRAYITNYMQTVNNLILDEDASNDDQIWEMVDMDSVVNWYLINELFKNADSQMQSSVYFYKDGTKNTDGELQENPDLKLHMAPVWDFDLGAGGVTYGAMNDPTGWRTRNDEYCGWFREFFEMDEFNAAVEARWTALHEEGILEAISTDVDALKLFVEEAALADFELWHDNYVDEISGTWMTVPEVSKVGDWEAQTSYLQSWLQERIAWMDGEFGYGNAVTAPSSTSVKKTTELFKNETFKGSSAMVKEFVIDRDIPVDELAINFDITSTCRFDLGVDVTVTAKNGTVLSHTVNMMGDWSNLFTDAQKSNGKVVAGTYEDLVGTLNGFVSWQLYGQYNNSAPSDFNTNPANYIKTVHLNKIVVTLGSEATSSDSFTFSTTFFNQAAKTLAEVSATKSVKTISGKPVIAGVPAVGNTLTALSSEIVPTTEIDSTTWLKNVWYVNGVQTHVGPTYTVKAADLGKNITVKSTGIFKFVGTSSVSDAVTVALSTQSVAAPAVPVKMGATRTSITVKDVAGQEFTVNGTDWVTGDGTQVKFTGLTAGQLYQVRTRVAATATAPAGDVSEALLVITSNNAQDYKRGDVDADGKIGTADAVISLMQALTFIDLKNDAVLDAADFNNDGRVTTSDARYILQAIVNTAS